MTWGPCAEVQALTPLLRGPVPIISLTHGSWCPGLIKDSQDRVRTGGLSKHLGVLVTMEEQELEDWDSSICSCSIQEQIEPLPIPQEELKLFWNTESCRQSALWAGRGAGLRRIVVGGSSFHPGCCRLATPWDNIDSICLTAQPFTAISWTCTLKTDE